MENPIDLDVGGCQQGRSTEASEGEWSAKSGSIVVVDNAEQGRSGQVDQVGQSSSAGYEASVSGDDGQSSGPQGESIGEANHRLACQLFDVIYAGSSSCQAEEEAQSKSEDHLAPEEAAFAGAEVGVGVGGDVQSSWTLEQTLGLDLGLNCYLDLDVDVTDDEDSSMEEREISEEGSWVPLTA